MNNKQEGMFVVFEGPDASGKTTSLPYVKQLFEEKGLEVVTTREPGGSPLAEKLREIILGNDMAPRAELLLFAAARADHVENTIKPALAAGKVVLCDRYMLSTYAYQGHGRGLKSVLADLEWISHENFYPDFTLYFDVSFEVSLQRLGQRANGDRMDNETEAFKRKLFQGYEEAYQKLVVPEIYRIDADPGIPEVQAQLKMWVDDVFWPAWEHDWDDQRGENNA